VEEMSNAYTIFVEKPQRKRLLGRFRRRGEGNIRMDCRETGWGDVDGVHLAEDRKKWRAFVNTIMNLGAI
jgi:hypothetical protein